MTTDNSQDDLWNTGNADESLFSASDQPPDIFGEISTQEPPVVTINSGFAPPSPSTPVKMAPVPHAPLAKAQIDGYVVLARKYRPQTFDDLVGQEGVQQALRGAIATGQISHSYLFSGPRGTGKTSTARILAKAVNCQSGGPRPDPCGICSSCRSITLGSSLDVIEIDAASNTGVDNIRELKSGIVLAPFSRYKVYIVDEVHMLSNQAFNALLKTLEEPPPQVIFILATTELHKVPETIISRCQTFMFRRFSMDELKNQLGSILDIEAANRAITVPPPDREKILDLIARGAEGGMRDAQVTLDQVLVLSKSTMDFESVRRFLGMADSDALDLFIQHINRRNSRELLELVDKLVANGQDLELFVKGVCEHMRDLLLIKCAGRETTMINVSEDRGLELEKIASGLPAPFLVNAVDQLLKTVGEMKVSGQPRIVLELAVLKLALVEPALDIQSILKRLDVLESEHKQKENGSQPVLTAGAANMTEVTKESRFQAEELAAPPEAAAEIKPVEKIYRSSDTPPPFIAENPDATMMTGSLLLRLEKESHMLYSALKKALVRQDCDGRVLILYINSAQKMQRDLLMRPQSVSTLSSLVQSLFGNHMVMRLLVMDVISSDTESNLNVPVMKPLPGPDEVTSTGEENPLEEAVASASVKDTGLKIYYPQEIREKTMVEVRASEFKQMLSTDAALKELVDKAKQAFGIDETSVKFHRSTLA